MEKEVNGLFNSFLHAIRTKELVLTNTGAGN